MLKFVLILLSVSVPVMGFTGSPDAFLKARAAIDLKDGHKAAEEFSDAVTVNIRPEHRKLLAPILAAVRYAENGRQGREYGVLHPKAVGECYRTQAGWSAATIQKQFDRYVISGGDPKDVAAYLVSLRNRYCPIGADNDPDGLNSHWLRNVTKFRLGILKGL